MFPPFLQRTNVHAPELPAVTMGTILITLHLKCLVLDVVNGRKNYSLSVFFDPGQDWFNPKTKNTERDQNRWILQNDCKPGYQCGTAIIHWDAVWIYSYFSQSKYIESHKKIRCSPLLRLSKSTFSCTFFTVKKVILSQEPIQFSFEEFEWLSILHHVRNSIFQSEDGSRP